MRKLLFITFCFVLLGNSIIAQTAQRGQEYDVSIKKPVLTEAEKTTIRNIMVGGDFIGNAENQINAFFGDVNGLKYIEAVKLAYTKLMGWFPAIEDPLDNPDSAPNRMKRIIERLADVILEKDEYSFLGKKIKYERLFKSLRILRDKIAGNIPDLRKKLEGIDFATHESRQEFNKTKLKLDQLEQLIKDNMENESDSNEHFWAHSVFLNNAVYQAINEDKSEDEISYKIFDAYGYVAQNKQKLRDLFDPLGQEIHDLEKKYGKKKFEGWTPEPRKTPEIKMGKGTSGSRGGGVDAAFLSAGTVEFLKNNKEGIIQKITPYYAKEFMSDFIDAVQDNPKFIFESEDIQGSRSATDLLLAFLVLRKGSSLSSILGNKASPTAEKIQLYDDFVRTIFLSVFGEGDSVERLKAQYILSDEHVEYSIYLLKNESAFKEKAGELFSRLLDRISEIEIGHLRMMFSNEYLDKSMSEIFVAPIPAAPNLKDVWTAKFNEIMAAKKRDRKERDFQRSVSYLTDLQRDSLSENLNKLIGDTPRKQDNLHLKRSAAYFMRDFIDAVKDKHYSPGDEIGLVVPGSGEENLEHPSNLWLTLMLLVKKQRLSHDTDFSNYRSLASTLIQSVFGKYVKFLDENERGNNESFVLIENKGDKEGNNKILEDFIEKISQLLHKIVETLNLRGIDSFDDGTELLVWFIQILKDHIDMDSDLVKINDEDSLYYESTLIEAANLFKPQKPKNNLLPQLDETVDTGSGVKKVTPAEGERTAEELAADFVETIGDVTTTITSEGAAAGFEKALKEHVPEYAGMKGERNETLTSAVKTVVDAYAKTGAVHENMRAILDQFKTDENLKKLFANFGFAWATAGIPLTVNYPTVEAATTRCVAKIGETTIKITRNGKSEDYPLENVFKKPRDKYGVYAALRTDENESEKLQKVFCGGIFVKAREE